MPKMRVGVTRVLVGDLGSKVQRYVSETSLLRWRRVVGVGVGESGGKKKKTLSEAMVRSTTILLSSVSYEPAMWPWKPRDCVSIWRTQLGQGSKIPLSALSQTMSSGLPFLLGTMPYHWSSFGSQAKWLPPFFIRSALTLIGVNGIMR